MDPEDKLADLGIELPEVADPVADYVPAVRTEDGTVYVSGQLPTDEDGELLFEGRVGDDVTAKQARQAAERCAVNILAAVEDLVGDLSRVERVVRVEGFVASADGFTQQPTVVNGASELFGDVFGDAGRHSRFAVGCNVLPLDTPVEIGAVLELDR
jgi:enamine deaminase RidA (YjgF/YER057c/UK114 family)